MKAIRDYLILVGVPILGVIILLHLGQGLQAPASIGGLWVAPELSGSLQGLTCGRELNLGDYPFLTISQSGPHLRIILGDSDLTAMSGTLDGLALTADESAPADDALALRLEATVDREAEPDVLSGRLLVENCPDSFPFTALRQPPVLNPDGTH